MLRERLRIGERIRMLRVERGYSQERLAEVATIDRKTLNRIEVGAHSVGIDAYLLVAGALDVSLAQLCAEV